MLFIFDRALTVLKMVNVGLIVGLQRHTKIFRYITVNGGKYFKRILTYLYCTKYNEIKLRHSNIYIISTFPIKSGINILFTGSYKSFPIHYGLWRGNF